MTVGNFTRYPTYNGSNLLDFFAYGNETTANYFWLLMIIMAYIIIFMTVSKNRGTKDAFGITSFICGIFAILLWAGGLLIESHMIIFVLLLLISIVLLWQRGDNEM